MVKYLVKDLKADIGQLGLDWNGVDYLTISPLVSAILYDSSSQQNIINYLMDQDAADESSVILNSVNPATSRYKRRLMSWSSLELRTY